MKQPKYTVGGYHGEDLGNIVKALLKETPELREYGLRETKEPSKDKPTVPATGDGSGGGREGR